MQKDTDCEKKCDSDVLSRTLGVDRMLKLKKIDEFLTNCGLNDSPASIKEICAYLKINVNDPNKQRAVRKNIKTLCDISGKSDSTFRITEVKKGKNTYYMIKPGHSLFRRDYNECEKQLINDLLQTMGSFDLPSLSQLKELALIANNEVDVTPKIKIRKCVDFNIKPPVDKLLFARLFTAISERKKINMRYKPVKNLSDPSAETFSIVFCPWQIRLFGDRWGLVGMADSDGFILKFYLDQISSAVIQSEGYDQNEMKRMDHLFDGVVGMSAPRHLCERHSNSEVAEVEQTQDVYIWVDPLRVEYLRFFPLHDTMDELDSESEQVKKLREKYPSIPAGGSFFWMNVYITHSLKQALVFYLDRMIVLEPESLRLDLEERITRMRDLYADLHNVE